MNKPTCKIIDTNGNVLAIIGKVSRTLKRAGQPDLAGEWTREAMACKSYDDVLQLMFEYVEPE